jgi:(2Fe-2S) ferredoxin
MAKLQISDLAPLRDKHHQDIALRLDHRPAEGAGKHLLICGGTGCHAAGSKDVRDTLRAELDKQGLGDDVKVIETGCNGFCALGPVMVVYPEGTFYVNLQSEDIPELIQEHIKGGQPVERLLFKDPASKERIPLMSDIPFFSHQKLVALKNRGLLDAESIDEYIAPRRLPGLGQGAQPDDSRGDH